MQADVNAGCWQTTDKIRHDVPPPCIRAKRTTTRVEFDKMQTDQHGAGPWFLSTGQNRTGSRRISRGRIPGIICMRPKPSRVPFGFPQQISRRGKNRLLPDGFMRPAPDGRIGPDNVPYRTVPPSNSLGWPYPSSVVAAGTPSGSPCFSTALWCCTALQMRPEDHGRTFTKPPPHRPEPGGLPAAGTGGAWQCQAGAGTDTTVSCKKNRPAYAKSRQYGRTARAPAGGTGPGPAKLLCRAGLHGS